MADEETGRPRRAVELIVGRSVTDLIILTFTLVVAISILATGATIAIIEIKDPTTDTTAIVETLTGMITTIIGALLGLIAGKNESRSAPPAPPP